MAGHAQLKFVMTECSKTQIGLSSPTVKIIIIIIIIIKQKKKKQYRILHNKHPGVKKVTRGRVLGMGKFYMWIYQNSSIFLKYGDVVTA